MSEEDATLSFDYLENLEENQKEEGDEKVKEMIKTFLIMQKPVIINLSTIIEKQESSIGMIHQDTLEETGWLKGEPLGISINNFIVNYKEYIRTSRYEVSNFIHLLHNLSILLDSKLDECDKLKTKITNLEIDLEKKGK